MCQILSTLVNKRLNFILQKLYLKIKLEKKIFIENLHIYIKMLAQRVNEQFKISDSALWSLDIQLIYHR